jgi:RNA 2',3'-cyclic 3'-phosphodiesterase
LRLFVGVELDDRLRAASAAAAEDLERQLQVARSNLVVRWTPEQNLHITLVFLGHVQDENAVAIRASLQTIGSVSAFPFTIGGAGIFPPSGPPRILWLGVSRGVDRFTNLYGELATRLLPLGYEAEARPYHPHVTVGRIKDAGRAASRTARAAVRCGEVGSGDVRAITLFASRLAPGGARYEALLRVPLKE